MPIRLWPPASDPASSDRPGEARLPVSSESQALGLYRQAGGRLIEAQAASVLPVGTLMQRAGAAVAALARALAPHARQVLVLAGPGNNGGDGFEAAWHLKAAGMHVQVCWAGTEAQLPADARAAWQRAVAAGVDIRPVEAGIPWPPAGAASLVIDALLGRGLSRPAGGAMAELIKGLNGRQVDVLAVDLPSGLQGDTGWLGNDGGDDDSGKPAPCVRARWTLALLSVAPGLWMAQGRDACGEIWFDDLGVDATRLTPPAAWLNRGEHQRAPHQRLHAGHKGSYGDVVVIGGASGMVGAATLAARAALQAGAGRVYLQALDAAAPRIDLLTPELMSIPPEAVTVQDAHQARASTDTDTDNNTEAATRAAIKPDIAARRLATATVVAGCGGGQAIAARLPDVIEHAARLVLDADALNCLAAQPALQQALRLRCQSGRAGVITPHPLEAARLLGCDVAHVQRDRLAAAQALADRLGCCVVLKGSGSVIAAPGCIPMINPSGNAALATPGSGDVLAGWLAGHWSQAAGQADAATAASIQYRCAAAVWSHGRGAELASPSGMAMPASLLIAALGDGRRARRF